MLATHDSDTAQGPIGIFDSGFGGLTILREIRNVMPQYDYVYLGDNARTPYGTRSFELVYEFTRQAVRWLFARGCRLIVLACNTASAKALRSIQQIDLPALDPSRRVLGVIRPTAECIGHYTTSRHIGVLATPGTVRSRTYELEIAKLFPDVVVTSEACPMWVSLVENQEYASEGADYFVRKNIERLMERDSAIDSVILGCTHYPFLLPKIRQYMPAGVKVLPQGDFVAHSLENYLSRHPEMQQRVSTGGTCRFFSTDTPESFNEGAAWFLGDRVSAELAVLE